MNEPVTFRRARIGREMYFPPLVEEEEGEGGRGDRWLGYFEEARKGAASSASCPLSSGQPRHLDEEVAARFSRHARSSLAVRLAREDLQKDFRISLEMRTFDQDGLVFAFTVSIRLGDFLRGIDSCSLFAPISVRSKS